nr:hypothetical protein Itr_chr03CG08850 [Ipomoea trifida]
MCGRVVDGRDRGWLWQRSRTAATTLVTTLPSSPSCVMRTAARSRSASKPPTVVILLSPAVCDGWSRALLFLRRANARISASVARLGLHPPSLLLDDGGGLPASDFGGNVKFPTFLAGCAAAWAELGSGIPINMKREAERRQAPPLFPA